MKFLPGDVYTLDPENVLEDDTETQQAVLTPCEPVHTSLEDAVPYIALSYASGDPSLTHHVVLNQCVFPVAKSNTWQIKEEVPGYRDLRKCGCNNDLAAREDRDRSRRVSRGMGKVIDSVEIHLNLNA